ncbi:hypothetical protein LC040_03910 [Bacillus tianshenii]|nr:hypothetical protein LC040_03910 [Bacillus tianshenii]
MLNVRTIVTYVLVFVVSLGLSFLEVSLGIILFTAFFLVSALIFAPFYHSVFLQKNPEKVEKFLVQNKKQPIYQFYYGLANERDEDVEEAYKKIVKKYKRKDKRAIYDIIYALYHHDPQAARQSINNIQVSLYKDYYKASIFIEERRFPLAEQILDEIPQDWMREALKAEIEMKTKRRKRAVPFAERALEHSRGLQKYMLYKNYLRELPELGLEELNK